MRPHLPVADQAHRGAAFRQPPATFQIADLVEQAGVEHPQEPGRDVPVERGPVRRLDHDAAHRPGKPPAAAPGEQLRHRPAGEDVHFQRTLDALRIVRMDAPRRRRIDTGKPRMQRRPSDAVRLPLDLRPRRRIRRGQRRETALQRSKVQPRPPREQRDVPRGPDVRDRAQGVVAELGRRVALVRVPDVDEPMRRPGEQCPAGLAGADVQMPEHQRRIDADDLVRAARRELGRDAGLAGRGGPHQEDDGTGAVIRTGYRSEAAGSGVSGLGAHGTSPQDGTSAPEG